MKLLVDLSEKMLDDIECFRESTLQSEGARLSRLAAIRLLLAESLGARELLPEIVPRLRLLANAYAAASIPPRRRRRRATAQKT